VPPSLHCFTYHLSSSQLGSFALQVVTAPLLLYGRNLIHVAMFPRSNFDCTSAALAISVASRPIASVVMQTRCLADTRRWSSYCTVIQIRLRVVYMAAARILRVLASGSCVNMPLRLLHLSFLDSEYCRHPLHSRILQRYGRMVAWRELCKFIGTRCP
jgi:hypothetical protein